MDKMIPTPSQDIINLFRQRFIQREDCYPLQIAGNGGYTVIREPITDAIIADHLQGSKTLGLYSSPDSTTKWLCIDIDTLDEAELRKVQQNANHLGIPFLTEFSGKKGYHIWIFFDKPYPNRIARALGQEIGLSHEIFPKQDHIEPGKLGNLVKAPLGTHQVTGNWCHFLDGNLKPEENQYAVLAEVMKIDPSQVLQQRLPETWVKALQEHSRSVSLQRAQQSVIVPVIKDCIRHAIFCGAGEGERNQIGHIIACELRRLGIKASQAKIILSSVWNPQNNPPLSESEIELLLSSAFGREEYSYGCKPGGTLRQRLTCVGYGACKYVNSFRTLSNGDPPQKSGLPS
jgi:hypothetical protein